MHNCSEEHRQADTKTFSSLDFNVHMYIHSCAPRKGDKKDYYLTVCDINAYPKLVMLGMCPSLVSSEKAKKFNIESNNP